jgi:hypothetical protein
MVCAVVSARVSPEFLERVHCVRLVPRVTRAVDLNTVADLVSASCTGLPGTVVAEPGDLYNREVWRVKSILGRDFKYPETLAERSAIELAHQISVAGRRLLIEAGPDRGNEG